MAHRQQDILPEFSRFVSLADVPEGGKSFRLEVGREERAALARRFDLVDLPSLDAEGNIFAFDHGRRARVEGIVRARVVQSCVVTLGPVGAEIEERFVRTYTNSPAAVDGPEILVDMDEDEPPDPIVGAHIDIGEAVGEILGLALDPYPRAGGAELPIEGTAAEAAAPKPPETARESPFSALKGLLKKL